MQIEIDFEVFKALTALRESESDSYNAVIQRLLRLHDQKSLVGTPQGRPPAIELVAPPEGAGASLHRGIVGSVRADLHSGESDFLRFMRESTLDGLWFGKAHFPNGTKFRATYKGESFFAEVRDGKWIDQDGIRRTSPSDAARAITGNNVNGWRFWLVQLPHDPSWRKLEDLKA